MDYVSTNKYCKNGNIIFKQRVGVPQEGNAGSVLADLTLSYLECIHSSNKGKNNNLIFQPHRYMDDILVVHNQTDEDIIAKMLNDAYNNTLTLEEKKLMLMNMSATFCILILSLLIIA